MYRSFRLIAGTCAIFIGGTAFAAHSVSTSITRVCQRTSPSQSRESLGSGRFVRQQIATASFSRIDVEGAAELEIAIGLRPSVEVETDDNLIGLMRADARDGRLKIHSEGTFCTTRTPRFRITMPRIESLELRGSGDARIADLSGGALKVVIAGSSNIRAAGALDAIDVAVDGSGDVDLTQLRAARVGATINGSGNVNIGSPRSLSAVVNGSGDIHYSGSPAFLEQSVHGSGRVWQH